MRAVYIRLANFNSSAWSAWLRLSFGRPARQITVLWAAAVLPGRILDGDSQPPRNLRPWLTKREGTALFNGKAPHI